MYLTTRVHDGLGNQLFKITAMFGLKEKVPDVKLIFISTDTEGKKNRPRVWNTFLADCPLIQEILVDKYPDDIEWEKLVFGTNFTYHEFYTRIIGEHVADSISFWIEDGFQNLKYFPSDKEFVRRLFNIEEKQRKLRSSSGFISEGSCSVHFRLGDYKLEPHYHTNLPDEYYKKALSLCSKEVKRVYIFNELEDQELVEQRVSEIINDTSLNLEVIYVVKEFEHLEDWEDLVLMSLCEVNIIANSTFSWWAAYFNTSTKIFYPHPITTPWVRTGDLCHWNLALEGWSAIL